MIILIILIIVLLLIPFLINKTLKKKDNVLEEVILQENTIKNDGFALMLETKNEDGTTSYVESRSSIWPTDMKFNSELSGCIDTNGNKIDNSLSFDSSTNLITIKTNKTSYCYVYFDIDNSAASYLIENISSEGLWNSTLENDGYRYVGTNPNNYICFGTPDKDTCTGDTDKYMYRIIGIFEDNNGNQHLKLIKKEALNTAYAWHSNNKTSTDWNESDLYKGINGSYFLINEEYSYMQDSTWADKIATWNYTMTNTKTYENYINNSVYGPDYGSITAQQIYLHELNRSEKSNQTCYYNESYTANCNAGEWKILNTKIGLMYVSDYALSLGNNALNYTSDLYRGTLKTGWINLKNNDSGKPGNWEWAMTYYGCDKSFCYTWQTSSTNGEIEVSVVHQTASVRPVFYLESDVELSTNSGDGSETNPFLLS